MINHLVATIHLLLGTYPDSEVVVAGDRNKLDISLVSNKVPNLRLVPSSPTYKLKQLDIILTTLGTCYKQAKVVDPIAPDKPSFKPSDHKIMILYPVDNLNEGGFLGKRA